MTEKKIEQTQTGRGRADYGIDAPYVVYGLLGSGLLSLLLALGWNSLSWMLPISIHLLVIGAIWLYCSKVGKLRLREKLMDALHLKGSEQVLDVGCGSGLLLVAAAKRLTTGKSVGVDIWRREDLANNRAETTLRNARIEGVAERVEIKEGDARQLPFGDATFDVVVSLNVLHNISRREEREKALGEIVRVLKPRGDLLISDFWNVGEYVRVFKEHGIADAHEKRIAWVLFFPIFAAIGRKSLN